MDKRPVIILAFANDSQSPLTYLAEEIKAVQSHLGKRDNQVKIIPLYKATIPDLRREIKEYKDRIVAFMYSGHSGQLQIDTADDAMSAIGLANELGVCPELKLVLINGCSSNGQVPHLMQKQVPYILTTEAPINDKAAAIFSATFWKELSEDNTVENAFELGRLNVENYSETSSRDILKIKTTEESRGSLDTGQNKSAIPWIFKTSLPEGTEWSLSDAIREFQQTPAFQTNKLLTETLYREFAKSGDEIADLDDFAAAETEIYSKFPQFITKYIHDLCATPVETTQAGFSQTNENDYFTEPNLKRLKKMIDFFMVLKELVKSITLSEIREELLRPSASMLPRSLTPLYDQTQRVSMAATVGGIGYLQGNTELLVRELTSIDPQVLLQADEFFEEIGARVAKSENLGAADYERLHPNQASLLCEKAEAQLSEVLTQLIFLEHYKFVTIKNIIVYKNRTNSQPSYGFKLSTYKWARADKYNPADSKEKILEQQVPDNHCILVVRNTKDLFGELNKGQYLNLSPFLIDNNVLYDKAQIPDISFCEAAPSGDFVYKRLNEPSIDNPPINNKSDNDDNRRFYKDLKTQFDHFNLLLDNQGTHAPAQ